MIWRERIKQEVRQVFADHHLSIAWELVDAIADAMPSPDERNGFAIVPIEPTEAMLLAPGMPYDGKVDIELGLSLRREAWRKMIHASR